MAAGMPRIAVKRRRLQIALAAMLAADISIVLLLTWIAVRLPGNPGLAALIAVGVLGSVVHGALVVWVERTPPIGSTTEVRSAPAIEATRQSTRRASWQAARLAVMEATMVRLAHDLRGALSPAMLAAERLQSSADPAQRRPAGILLRSVDRATRLVNQAMEQIRAEGAITHSGSGSLRAMVEAASAQIDATRMKVKIDIEARLEVTASSGQIVQLLGELLRNADAAGASNATVSAACHDRTLLLTVADNGPGLPASLQLDPFHHREERRAGWGLAIVQLLTRAHSGTVTLAETGPQGTTFVVSLPILRKQAG